MKHFVSLVLMLCVVIALALVIAAVLNTGCTPIECEATP